MLETLRKAMLAGLATLEITEEKLQAALGDLRKRGELSEQEARELVNEWRQRMGKQRAELQREAGEAVQRALRGLNVATRQDLEALTRRLETLERRLASGRDDADPEC